MKSSLRAMFPIFLLTAGHGAVDSYLAFIQILAPGLATHLAIPLGDVVMLVGVGALVANGSQPFVGHIMGRVNMAWALGFSVALSSLTMFMGYVSGFWSLAAIVVLGAIGTAIYHPEAVLSAHDEAGEKAYLGVPLFMAGGGGIYAIAAPVAVRVSETWGFHAILLLALPGLLVAFLLFQSYRALKRRHPSIVIRPRSKRLTRVQSGSLSFWPLLGVGMCLCVGSGLFLALLSSHFELLFGPASRSWSGWTLMVLGVASAGCSFLWSSLSRRYGFYLLALVTQIIAFPLFLLMAAPSSPWTAFLFAIPLSLVAPASVHPMAVILARNAAGSTQAMRSSLMIGGTYGVASVAIMVAGFLLRNNLPSQYLLLFVAGCSLVAAILSLWQWLVLRRWGEASAH